MILTQSNSDDEELYEEMSESFTQYTVQFVECGSLRVKYTNMPLLPLIPYHHMLHSHNLRRFFPPFMTFLSLLRKIAVAVVRDPTR